jgi:hypothetical protein
LRLRFGVRVRVKVDHATDCERGADGVAHLNGACLGFGFGLGLGLGLVRVRVRIQANPLPRPRASI